MNQITMRVLKTVEEMQLVQQLEQTVWGMEAIPVHQTLTAVKNGGLIIGAFDEEKLVGFSYGFAGYQNNEAYLCSHMLGIHPDYQLQGIGKKLKEEQLVVAKEMGYKLITWTFDPLESRNAYLNVSKLYGIVDTYIENCYGEMTGGINAGLPTDRLQIEWWITSDRVEKKWMPSNIIFDNPFQTALTEQNLPILEEPESFDPTHKGYEVPVPQQFQVMKKISPETALQWRLQIRKIIQTLFSKGYALVAVRKTDEPVNYYQFVQRSTIPIQTEEN
ncbi:GNAT family N-acetyltransferase [Psychrobacillus sp. NEAU-3TGS]|uniref:GNAT family N-acetyltransferase n=1 Tax=Psychrobacillus sp. NEAU-3TGS TaxID=2995412 RepID=UPI0024960D36|nr:GNAT family N-acetyltransferase [Psychrobacillus sp. NEAU-3TGS]MDI2589803.1 GNAT family N-acetyltransferase [Psychrobacillus sp. NEAU-3TGS]